MPRKPKRKKSKVRAVVVLLGRVGRRAIVMNGLKIEFLIGQRLSREPNLLNIVEPRLNAVRN
jgi:hypothetical protein